MAWEARCCTHGRAGVCRDNDDDDDDGADPGAPRGAAGGGPSGCDDNDDGDNGDDVPAGACAADAAPAAAREEDQDSNDFLNKLTDIAMARVTADNDWTAEVSTKEIEATIKMSLGNAALTVARKLHPHFPDWAVSAVDAYTVIFRAT